MVKETSKTVAYIIYFFATISLIYTLYKIYYIQWDMGEEDNYLSTLTTDIQNKKIAGLSNMNTIENLPMVNFQNDNAQITDAKSCYQGFVETSFYATDESCGKVCLDSNARVVRVGEDDEIYHNNTKLAIGTYCTISIYKDCNPNTSYAHMTITGARCVSRFPRIFGGETGGEVIACKNNEFPSNEAKLYDFKEQNYVTSSTKLNDEDELFEGEYRFQCTDFGTDDYGNKLLPHISNRFMPVRDPCKHMIIAAHPTVKTVIETNDWHCDCGDYSVTRVGLVDPSDPKSGCTGCLINKSTDFRSNLCTLYTPMNNVTIPYSPPNVFKDSSSVCFVMELEYDSKPPFDFTVYEASSF